jgi:cytochrome c oxidase cbb3-type subunit III
MAMLDSHEDKHEHDVRDFDGVIDIRSNPVPRYFAILFYGLVIWAVPFMGYYLLSGWSSEGEFAQKMALHQEQVAALQGGGGSAAPATIIDPEAQAAEGAKLYAQSCAVCHGGVGEGGIGPALDTDDYAYGKEPAAVRQSIADGRPGGMPAFSAQLSAAQIEALTIYITQALDTVR